MPELRACHSYERSVVPSDCGKSAGGIESRNRQAAELAQPQGEGASRASREDRCHCARARAGGGREDREGSAGKSERIAFSRNTGLEKSARRGRNAARRGAEGGASSAYSCARVG